MWNILNFGRYSNKTLPQVVLSDPDYFFRANDTFVFYKQGFLEASDLAGKARHIKIPKPETEDWGVKYDFEPDTRKFCGFKLVHGFAPVEVLGMPGCMWKPAKHLDLSIVYRPNRRDKAANDCLLRDFKLHYFGNANAKLSRGQCEEFFEDTTKFHKPPDLSEFM
jgi:hypothetical protein